MIALIKLKIFSLKDMLLRQSGRSMRYLRLAVGIGFGLKSQSVEKCCHQLLAKLMTNTHNNYSHLTHTTTLVFVQALRSFLYINKLRSAGRC